MRSGSKLALVCGAIACLVGGAGGSVPRVTATTSAAPSSGSLDSLRAERASLVAQLQSSAGARGEARAQLLAAEAALASVEQQLTQTRQNLDSINAALRTLSSRIAADERDLGGARTELAALLRTTYKSSDRDGFAGAILASTSFSDAMDRVQGAQQVTSRVHELQQRVVSKESGLLQERAALQAKGALSQSLEGQLGEDSGRLLAAVAARDAVFRSIDGPSRDLATRIAALDDQISQGQTGSSTAGPVDTSSPCGNHFTYGYCTWYVATRRCIPWMGNAWQWWGNARAYGYAEGSAPQRGAVAVWGQSGSSPLGHVAYVEAVGPSGGVPAGSFLVSEMNYTGWGRVDYRTVPNNAAGLLGFIYGNG